MRPLPRRALFAALTLAATAATAQEAEVLDPLAPPGSPLFTAGISQGFTVDSNLRLDDPNPGTSTFADTRVQLGLLSETQLQVLSFGIDTGLRALWEADQDFDFTFASPSTANLDYLRDWASGGLEAGLRYRQTEVDDDPSLADFVDPDTGELPDDFEPDDLNRLSDEAIERRFDATLDLSIAEDAPSSYEFSLAATDIDYDDTSDDVTPRSSFQGDALWRLRLTPVLSGALFANYLYRDSDNPRNTLVREADAEVGVIYEPSEVLRLDFGVGYADYERRETVGGARRTISDTGPAVRIGLRYAFEAVTLVGAARYTQATDGAPLTGSLRAIYSLPNGQLTGRLFQSKTGSSTGNQVRVTGAALGILRELDTVSAIEFDLTAARQVDETAPFEPDTTRYGFEAVYTRAITEVVSANLGYRLRTFDQNPDEAVSNAVFFQIGRSFASRF